MSDPQDPAAIETPEVSRNTTTANAEADSADKPTWSEHLVIAKNIATEKLSNVSKVVKESETAKRIGKHIESGTDKLAQGYEAARSSETAKRTSDAIAKASTRASQILSAASDQISSAKNAVTEKHSAITEALRERTAQVKERAVARYPRYFGSKEETHSVQEFRNALAHGFEAVEISAGLMFQLPFRVDKGQNLKWEFYLWDNDIGFKLVHRTMAMGGAVEIDVHSMAKCESQSGAVKGNYRPDEPGTLVLVWDNEYSWFKSKHVAYRVRVCKPDEESPSPTVSAAPASPTVSAAPASPTVSAAPASSISQCPQPAEAAAAPVETPTTATHAPSSAEPRGDNVPSPAADVAPPAVPSTDTPSAQPEPEPVTTVTSDDNNALPDPDDPAFWDKMGIEGVTEV